MFQLVHPGVAYLLSVGYSRFVGREPPGRMAMLALLVGSVIPDLVDQPLYYLGVAPNTRTVAHSVLAGVVLSGLVALAVSRSATDDRVGTAFATGYLSHLLADAVWPLVLWIPGELRYLGWPLTRQPPYEGVKPLGTVGGVTVTTLWVELALLAAAIALWWRDGRPGVRRVDG